MSLFAGARRHPSAVLLVVQLLGVLIYPLTQGSPAGRIGFEIIGIVVLVLAVFSVRATPGLTWISIGLGIPAVTLSFIDVYNSSDAVVAVSAVLHAAFYFYAAYSLLRYMLSDHNVSTDELYATGATFTLVAWGFAYLYVFVQVLVPGSFIAAVAPSNDRSWMELLFLSFTTLSSTGLSDVVPVSDWGRSVVMFEQLAGLGYVAMVVSRLVGLTLSRRTT
ncbi:two pore domain potassium channel family protein [Kribbella antibiotica]|uniref:Two pore domain potassium channel family protein n=1 Tax=Kribbella antibiotica TaxID=190195 RepID=A0A4R4ZFV1_9ACTN|nr:potassium channel family protein [Kribbella antibiotica]TDD57438.1 two pore domain potassium channel family protein [Kribbella antibiotica]